MSAAGVEFLTEPRDEPYGRVAVFVDVAGTGGTSSARDRADPTGERQTCILQAIAFHDGLPTDDPAVSQMSRTLVLFGDRLCSLTRSSAGVGSSRYAAEPPVPLVNAAWELAVDLHTVMEPILPRSPCAQVSTPSQASRTVNRSARADSLRVCGWSGHA